MKKNIFTSLLIICAIAISILLKLLPYIVYYYDYLVGFDSGKYILDLVTHTSTGRGSMSLFVEPGLNTTLSVINTLIQMEPIAVFKFFLPVLVSVYYVLIVFLFCRKITNSNSAAIFSAFFLATSLVFMNSTFDSYYRQIFSTMIFMTFFYLFDYFINSNTLNVKNIIILGLLGAGIIISHRGVSLLYVLLLFTTVVKLGIEKDYNTIKSVVIIGVISLLISAVYWIFIVVDNVTILKDSIELSFSGKNGGNTTIRTLTRNDNQIIGYISTISSSFIPIIGLLFLIFKKKFTPFLIFTSLLIFYIYLKATFSNRFLFNLDILLAVLAGVAYDNLRRYFSRKAFILIVVCIILLNFIHAVDSSMQRTPYVQQKTKSIAWLEDNVNKESSVIFAPDALGTVLTQMSFKTSLYEYQQKTRSLDSPTYTEEVLTSAYKDPSILKELPHHYQNIYIVFGEWNLTHPLPRVNKLIPVNKWDSSKYFTKVYDGDDTVKRVYRFNSL